jgi:hypothetical protein
MTVTSTPAYYLIMIGGSLTIVSAITILIAGNLNAYYARFFSELNQITAFALTLLPGLAVIYLGQRFLRKPQTQLQSSLAVAVVSVISLVAVVGSGVTIYIGLFFSGPPISFAGGLTGAFLSRAGESLLSRPNPPTEDKALGPEK